MNPENVAPVAMFYESDKSKYHVVVPKNFDMTLDIQGPDEENWYTVVGIRKESDFDYDGLIRDFMFKFHVPGEFVCPPVRNLTKNLANQGLCDFVFEKDSAPDDRRMLL